MIGRSARGPWIALAFALIAAVLGAGVRLDDDVTRMLPDSDPRLSHALEVMRGLLDRTVIDVGIETGAEPTPAELGGLADALVESISVRTPVARVRARFGVDDVLEAIDLLRSHAPALLPDSAYAEIDRRIASDAVTPTIAGLAQRLMEPDGAGLRLIAARDPLQLTDLALRPLQGMTAGFDAARILDGRLVSSDRRHVLLFVEPGFEPSDPRSAAYVAAVEEAARELEVAHGGRGVSVRHIGAHRATADNTALVKRDVLVTTTAGVLAVALIALLCFGSLWRALLALLPALYGSTIAVGVFALFADAMTGPVVGFGAVLLGLTVDFAIHVLLRVRQGEPAPIAAGPRRWLGLFDRVDLPVRGLAMGATTTAVAFATLGVSSLPGVRDIGVFGAVGILAAGVFALVVLPWMGRWGRPRLRVPVDPARVVAGLARSRPAAVVAVLLATPILGLGALRVAFDGDPDRMSGLSAGAAADERGLFATWGEAFRSTTLVIEARDLETALAENDRLAEFLDARRTAGRLRDVASISGALPSAATQRARVARWRAFWAGPRRDALGVALDAAVEATVFRPGAFAPFLAWLDGAPALLDPAAALDGPLAPLVGERVRRHRETWVVTTQVFVADWEQFESLDAALRDAFPGVIVLNKTAFVRRFADMVGAEFAELGGLAFGAVALVVWLWLGSLELTLVVLLPLLVSLAWTLGLLGWLGVPITLANSIFVAFLFGVAVDYSIFLTVSRLERWRTGVDHIAESHASVLLCALTTCFGFGALLLARHPVMFSIGATALIGLLSAAIVTQLLVPPLVALFVRGHGPNQSPALRHLFAATFVARTLVGGALRFRWTSRRVPPERLQSAAIAAIGAIARRIRDKRSIGRRLYVDASGRPTDRLAVDGPCVIVSNHASGYDVMAVLALPRPIQILVKRWVAEAPVIGRMVRSAGYVAIDAPSEQLIDLLRARVAAGNSILVFPEGTRTRSGRIGRFHNGAFAIARALDLPVQPIALVGTADVLPPGGFWVGDHDARVVVLEPMAPRDWVGDGADRRMARAARDRIREAARALLPDAYRGRLGCRVVGGAYRLFGPVLANYAFWKVRLDPLFDPLPALCPGDGPVLVAGCGYGLLTTRLSHAYPERSITAIDVDQVKLDVARRAVRSGAPVEFAACDAADLDRDDFEVALLVDVLHYAPADAQVRIVQNLARRLRPGGRILFRDGCTGADRSSRSNRAMERLATRIGFSTVRDEFCFRDEAGWRALFAMAGLEVAATHPDLSRWSNVVLTFRPARHPE